MLEKIKFDEHLFEVLKKSGASLIVKILGVAAGLFVSIFLGRTIGAEGMGIINLTNRLTAMVLIFAMLGMRQYLVREISVAISTQNSGYIRSIMQSAYLLNGVTVSLFVVIMLFFVEHISENLFENSNLTLPLYLATVGLIPQVFSRLISSGLVGFRLIWQSNLVNNTLSSAVVALALFCCEVFDREVNVEIVSLIYLCSRVVVMITVLCFWRSVFSFRDKPNIEIGKHIRGGLPFLLLSSALVLSSSVDTVMLGWLGDTEDVGVYNVALRLATLTAFLLQIINSALMPKIAALYAKGEIQTLRKLVRHTTFLLFLVGLSPMLIYVIFGRSFLSIWGPEFSSAYPVLLILSFGQFINIATGPVGTLLAMTKNEKTLQNITLISLICNVILNYFFISNFGVIGAASVTAFTILLNMCMSAYYVWKNMGFLPFL